MGRRLGWTVFVDPGCLDRPTSGERCSRDEALPARRRRAVAAAQPADRLRVPGLPPDRAPRSPKCRARALRGAPLHEWRPQLRALERVGPGTADRRPQSSRAARERRDRARARHPPRLLPPTSLPATSTRTGEEIGHAGKLHAQARRSCSSRTTGARPRRPVFAPTRQAVESEGAGEPALVVLLRLGAQPAAASCARACRSLGVVRRRGRRRDVVGRREGAAGAGADRGARDRHGHADLPRRLRASRRRRCRAPRRSLRAWLACRR